MFFSRIFLLLLSGGAVCLAWPLLNVNITKGDVRIPVILVQFEDVEFSMEDPKSYYTDFLNKEGFKENGNFGSVRDYYIYNSMEQYRPLFDVYGPVNFADVKAYYDTLNGAAELILAQALDSLSDIDFSMYDNDGDGEIEAISFIYAGARENKEGPELWPSVHLANLKINDDFVVTRFSCVDERNEVSTFVHELGHILGLPDLYVSTISVVGSWSPMDHAEKIPSLYSSFERILMGWLVPEKLSDEGLLRLDKLDDNVALAITNPENENEMYLLEYRTNKNWDCRQPNSGMLIWYVDYEDSLWNNSVNRSGCHARQYVVRSKSMKHVEIATGEKCSFDAGEATASDVFPGRENVTVFDRFIFRNGLNMNITLSEITESEDKDYVTFKVLKSEPYMMDIESSSSSSEPFRIHYSSSISNIPYSLTVVDTLSIVEPSFNVPVKQKNQIWARIQKGTLSVRLTAPGTKEIKLFSLNGLVLFETTMEGSEMSFYLPKHIGHQKVLLQITQSGASLYQGIISGPVN